ncbi:MAG: hypothetical protein ACJ71M_06565 [Nitrososphaeraceae archaeon]
MITLKFTAILAVIAMLALSPSFMTTMTALAVKGDFDGSGSAGKHFDGDGSDSKQITHGVDRHFNDNNNNNDDHNNHNDNVKVIRKTVVVHDNNDNQRTIVINSNLQGTCFVTQSQIAHNDNLIEQLLDQCVSVTIIRG